MALLAPHNLLHGRILGKKIVRTDELSQCVDTKIWRHWPNSIPAKSSPWNCASTLACELRRTKGDIQQSKHHPMNDYITAIRL